MRQTLHILRKDARYLWAEIVILNLTAALFTQGLWESSRDSEGQFSFMVAPLAGVAFVLMTITMIGRLIHGDALVGDRQFWVTRPYDWRSLLAAKAAFLMVFISLPLFLLRLAFMTIMGFPVAASVGPLLWSHGVLLMTVGAPAIAVAAMTKGNARYLAGLLMALLAVATTTLPTQPFEQAWPHSFEWIRYLLFAVLATASGVVVIYLQFRRKTEWSFAVALAGVAAACLVYFAVPLSFGLAFQDALPGDDPAAAESVRINVRALVDKPSQPVDAHHAGLQPAHWNPSGLTVRVSSTDPGLVAWGDALRAEVITPDGRRWDSGWGLGRYGSFHFHFQPRYVNPFPPPNPVDDFLQFAQGQPLTLRMTVYGTVWGDQGPPLVIKPDAPRALLAPGLGVECAVRRSFYQSDAADMIAACSRPVAWANWRVSGDTPPVDESGDSALGGSFFNYTPFPSGVTLALTAEYSTWVRLEKPGPISLRIMKPLAHFKREIELRDVRATDPIDIVR